MILLKVSIKYFYFINIINNFFFFKKKDKTVELTLSVLDAITKSGYLSFGDTSETSSSSTDNTQNSS